MSEPNSVGAATALVAVAIGATIIWGSPAETFTGTASIRTEAARATAPFTLTITHYASKAERDALLATVRQNGSAGARRILSGMQDAGVIQLGERRTAIKFASQRPTSSGRLVTVVTAEPMVFIGGRPHSEPRAGFDLALAFLDLQEVGGVGELAPAAKIGVDRNGALFTEDYGATIIWLDGLTRAR